MLSYTAFLLTGNVIVGQSMFSKLTIFVIEHFAGICKAENKINISNQESQSIGYRKMRKESYLPSEPLFFLAIVV